MSKHRKVSRFLSVCLAAMAFVIVLFQSPTVQSAPEAGSLADFEGGLPEGWFTFFGGSTVTTTTEVVADTDALALPGQTGDNEILKNEYNVTDFGGFGQDLVAAAGGPQNWSTFESFNFWFYGTGSGLSYQAEISDNRSDPGSDTSERFDYTFTDNTAGWQYYSIPFSDFTRATDFQPGGAPDDGFTLTEIWAWAIVLPQGQQIVYFDAFSLGERVVDDFENGLPTGTDADGVPIGFYTFQGAGSSIVIATETTPPAPILPEIGEPNSVLQLDIDSTTYAGMIHGFENAGVTEWVPQDWSKFGGIALWLYGNNSGADVFIDLLENRNPGSTTDDAERWTVPFKDDFSGWRRLEFPFNTFTRKDVGNGAPNDGLTLEEVHGWAFGTLSTEGARTYYIDNVTLFGVAEIPDLAVTFSAPEYEVIEGNEATVTVKLTRELGELPDDPTTVSVDYSTEPGTAVPNRDYTPVSGTLTFMAGGPTEQTFSVPTFDNPKRDGDKTAILRLSNPVDIAAGFTTQAVLAILDDDSLDPTLLDDFERGAYLWHSDGATLTTPEIAKDDPLALPDQGDFEHILQVRTRYDMYFPIVPIMTARGAAAGGAEPQVTAANGASFGRDFPIGADWSRGEALSFWFYGTGSGDEITLQLKDNRAPDPGPTGWSLTWSEEFNEPAGTPPNPAIWSYEVGDGAVNRIPGWGNNELQYYTSSTDNSATDGNGNLVITAAEADGSLVCYYGPCDYTSARLISQYKAEFAYGRVESRIRVPQGAGLWPAFWSLGTDIGEVGWPQTGEIDIMEFVGREPNEIFGTIHGPGYSGGASFGGFFDFGEPVYTDYHTFAIEWQPDLIEWYVDDILYHTAVPADVAPNEWVFNDPIFLILNVAVGGNFGGPVGDDTTFPQSMVVDYVRVYQGPDTAERWEATFADDFDGWQQVTIPFSALTRSADQPDGAPDDGLTLSEVWGYGFKMADGVPTSGILRMDQVRLELAPRPDELTVTNLNDSGEGSLRQALEDIADGGTITFDSALAGGTLALTSGPLVPARSVTIDASGAPGIVLDGGGADRLLIVDAGLSVSASHLVFSNGYGWQLAGGILNNGSLTLAHATVSDNLMATDAGDFWQGGGGIYNGDGASLMLVDSTVTNNTSGWTGGGIYSFFNSSTSIIRSTISDNLALDVAGGMRLLGDGEIVNSTLSGNTSTTWHGGALFLTDGVVTMTNATVVGNNAPAGTTGGLFTGTFTDASATLTIQNSIVANNGDFGCFLAPFGAGAVALDSLGNNVFTDGTCSPIGSDQVVGDALVDVLADNGGPTWTHALLAGSPAIDAANNAVCEPTDQRGVARDAACDAGAFEYVP